MNFIFISVIIDSQSIVFLVTERNGEQKSERYPSIQNTATGRRKDRKETTKFTACIIPIIV
jgi:hypothetical protein